MTPQIQLATVTDVVTGGVKLRFDGELAARNKTYACVGTSPEENDRVCVIPISGTYVVIGVLGGAGGGGGDVYGPDGATAGHVAILDATGKVISDGGKAAASIVTGPASATAGNLAALDATGKVLSDSGLATPSGGTWSTVTARGATTAGTPVFTTNYANYYVVGELVCITFGINMSNRGGATGVLLFGELPFPSAAGGFVDNLFTCYLNGTLHRDWLLTANSSAAGNILLVIHKAGTGALTAEEVTSNLNFYGQIVYRRQVT